MNFLDTNGISSLLVNPSSNWDSVKKSGIFLTIAL
jgi:hypothetical protein